MRRFYVIAGVLLAFLLVCASNAGASGVGTHLAAFLEVDGGTRQMGMGGAFTGLADDANCVFYNPAGLMFLEGSQINISHSTWPAGISYQHLTYGFRHSYIPGVFAMSWTIMQMPPYKEKTEYYDPDSEFGIGIIDNVDAGDMCWGGTYCWEFSDRLAAATTIKYYHLALADAFCEGMAADFGVLWDTRMRNLRLGAAVMNVGPDNRWANTGSESNFGEDFSMPMNYRVGASMRVYDVVTHRVVLAGDYRYTANGKSRVNMGGEYTFHTGTIYVYGRLGYRVGYDEEGLTAGGGVFFPTSDEVDTRVDYAYIPHENLGSSHRIAVAFMF